MKFIIIFLSFIFTTGDLLIESELNEIKNNAERNIQEVCDTYEKQINDSINKYNYIFKADIKSLKLDLKDCGNSLVNITTTLHAYDKKFLEDNKSIERCFTELEHIFKVGLEKFFALFELSLEEYYTYMYSFRAENESQLRQNPFFMNVADCILRLKINTLKKELIEKIIQKKTYFENAITQKNIAFLELKKMKNEIYDRYNIGN